MPIRAAAARGLRRPVERRFFSRAMSRCSSALFQEVDDSEQGDPDDIDEVPVVRNDDRAGPLLATEVLDGVRAAAHEVDRDNTAGDVRAVDPGTQGERCRIALRREGNTTGERG